MEIRSFHEAKDAAMQWLREQHGATDDSPARDVSGWRLDESGFYQSRYEDWIRPYWCVRYWQVDRTEPGGALRVYEDGEVRPGTALFMGCLGLFPAGLFRIEPDATTPVMSGYGQHPEEFGGSLDPRYTSWIREGWPDGNAREKDLPDDFDSVRP